MKARQSLCRWLAALPCLGLWGLILASGVSCGPAPGPGTTVGPSATPLNSTAESALPLDPLKAFQAQWEQNHPQQQAQHFWRRVQQRYAKLSRYSDQAQIHLSYQLTGNRMLEAMPMAVAFDRGAGVWACQAFRSRIWAESTWMAVKIQEAATNHLDRQVKVLPAARTVSDLWVDDPVAKIYLSGATDLPLSDLAQSQLPLFAPQLSWLLDAAPAGPGPQSSPHQRRPGLPPESLPPESVELVGWTWLGECPCVRLAGRQAGFRCEYWVDIQRELIVRILFPAAVLSPALEHSPEIRGLQICLDLGEIRVDQEALPPPGRPDLPSDRTVRRFVKIPEAFPSPWIAQPSPNFLARDRDGSPWEFAAQRDRYVVGLFVAAAQTTDPWQELWAAVVEAHPQLPLSGIIVHSDWTPVPVDRDPTSPEANPGAKRNFAATVLPDGADLWATLGFTPGSWLAIWDPNGVLQYAGPLDTTALRPTITTILQRLAAGEQVGADMIRDYQQFYEEYLQQLRQSLLLEQPDSSVNRAAQAH